MGRLRQVLIFERFLVRVFAVLGNRVVAKGGVVLELRLARARTTQDVDLGVSGDLDAMLEAISRAGGWISATRPGVHRSRARRRAWHLGPRVLDLVRSPENPMKFIPPKDGEYASWEVALATWHPLALAEMRQPSEPLRTWGCAALARWGIECRTGWRQVVERMLDGLERAIAAQLPERRRCRSCSGT